MAGRCCQPSSAVRGKNTSPWESYVGKNGLGQSWCPKSCFQHSSLRVTLWKPILMAPLVLHGCWAGSTGECRDGSPACPVVMNWDPSSSIWFSPSTEESRREARHFPLPVKGEICSFWFFRALSSMLQSPSGPGATHGKCARSSAKLPSPSAARLPRG